MGHGKKFARGWSHVVGDFRREATELGIPTGRNFLNSRVDSRRTGLITRINTWPGFRFRRPRINLSALISDDPADLTDFPVDFDPDSDRPAPGRLVVARRLSESVGYNSAGFQVWFPDARAGMMYRFWTLPHGRQWADVGLGKGNALT